MPSAPGSIDPRPDRSEAGSSLAVAPDGGGVNVPRTRVWGWYIDAAMNQRTTRVSPPFTGPAMIYEMGMRYPNGSGIGGWSLYWANDDGGTQTGGLPGTRPTGNPIFETQTFSSAVGSVDPDEITEKIPTAGNAGEGAAPPIISPRYIIPTADRFFLKVTVRGGNAAGSTYRGWVVVIEAATFQDLLSFR